MEQQMLRAAQEATWAAQSAAEAAWWALLLNGLTAVGAIGALWYAIVQGGRAARFERLRAAMEVTRVLEALRPVVGLLTIDEDGAVDVSNGIILINGGLIEKAFDAVSAATFEHVPSTTAIGHLEDLKMSLPSVKMTLELPFNVPGLLKHDVETIHRAERYLRLFQRVLMHNSLRARWEMRRDFH